MLYCCNVAKSPPRPLCGIYKKYVTKTQVGYTWTDTRTDQATVGLLEVLLKLEIQSFNCTAYINVYIEDILKVGLIEKIMLNVTSMF